MSDEEKKVVTPKKRTVPEKKKDQEVRVVNGCEIRSK